MFLIALTPPSPLPPLHARLIEVWARISRGVWILAVRYWIIFFITGTIGIKESHCSLCASKDISRIFWTHDKKRYIECLNLESRCPPSGDWSNICFVWKRRRKEYFWVFWGFRKGIYRIFESWICSAGDWRVILFWRERKGGKNIFWVSTRVFAPGLEKCRQSDRLSGCNRGGREGGSVKALIYGTAPRMHEEAEETCLNIGGGKSAAVKPFAGWIGRVSCYVVTAR